MVRRLGNVEQVIRDAAHEVAGLGLVIPRKGKALVGVEQVLTHARLHTDAHDVAPSSHKVTASKANQVHGGQTRQQTSQCREDFFRTAREQARTQRSQNLREGKVDSGDDEGTRHICPKEPALSLVIRDKAGKSSRLG